MTTAALDLSRCCKRILGYCNNISRYRKTCKNVTYSSFRALNQCLQQKNSRLILRLSLSSWQKCFMPFRGESTLQCHNENKPADVKDHKQWSDVLEPEVWSTPLEMPEPEYDWEYLCEDKKEEIKENIMNRKGRGDIDKVLELKSKYAATGKKETRLVLMKAACDIPNRSSRHSPVGDECNAKLVETYGEKAKFPDFKPKPATKIGESLNLIRMKNLAITTGSKSYYFLADLAQMEQALIQLAVNRLMAKGFDLVTVPEIINPAVIEACGFHTTGPVTQVYNFEQEFHGDQCLIGTAEMPLAAFFLNDVLEESDLPKRLCSVSRCYRAEAPNEAERHSIYRVHQFTKVEMFGLSGSQTEDEADNLLLEYLEIEKEMFKDLGIYFRVLEMPTQELGAPAYRKFDIEAWLPAIDWWGEISSASNCTDYQSRRLNIKYRNKAGETRHVHTVNGTACAIPRMIMTIFENFQNKDGTVNIPEVLQPLMNGKKLLTKSDAMPSTHWIKYSKVNWTS